MGRFDFKRPPPLKEVVAAEGTNHAVTFSVPTPVGKFWNELSTEILEIVTKFEDTFGKDDSNVKGTIAAFRLLTSNPQFWKKFLPAVIGIRGTKEEKEAQKYIEGALTNREIVTLFMEASEAIVMYSFQGDEVEEALEKSEGGEAAKEESEASSDGTMPPA